MAGLGNHRIATNLMNAINHESTCQHLQIEDLIDQDLKQADFGRYEYICRNYPWVLYFIYYFPISYWRKFIALKFIRPNKLQTLINKMKHDNIKTVIAVNHRAALWVGALKYHNLTQCELNVLIPDYSVGSGWRYLFWNQITRVWGPVPNKLFKSKYTHCPIPIDKKINQTNKLALDKKQILITGGGWGLGPLNKICAELHNASDGLEINVVCGNNRPLFNELRSLYKSNHQVRIFGCIDSLIPLIQQASAIITRPGASTIAESLQFNKKIFIIPGLPGPEQENARYLYQNGLAVTYTKNVFFKWLKPNSSA